jgi:4-aminobutyrate aminotransferase-like enzyme
MLPIKPSLWCNTANGDPCVQYSQNDNDVPAHRHRGLEGREAAQAVIDQAAAAGGKIAAFFCESALSCAGQIMLPDGYLAEVYDVMGKHGALCIADEVQTGFGRLGTSFWAFEMHVRLLALLLRCCESVGVRCNVCAHLGTWTPCSTCRFAAILLPQVLPFLIDMTALMEEHKCLLQGVRPDIVTMGKAMGNGFPVSGVVASAEAAAAFELGPLYFNTYGGCNAAAASGLAVLQVMEAQGLQSHAKRVGQEVLAGLDKLRQRFPEDVGVVRGMGMFLGIEMVQSRACKRHAPGKAKWLKERLKAKHVCLSASAMLAMLAGQQLCILRSSQAAHQLIAPA